MRTIVRKEPRTAQPAVLATPLGLATDQTGAPVEGMLHYPFGQEWQNSAGFGWDEKFAQLQTHDVDLSLYMTTSRLYKAGIGRWLTPDPAGLAAANPANPQSWNRYAYVLNNPATLTDPLGTDPGGPTLAGGCPNSDPAGINAQGETIYTSCNAEEAAQSNQGGPLGHGMGGPFAPGSVFDLENIWVTGPDSRLVDGGCMNCATGLTLIGLFGILSGEVYDTPANLGPPEQSGSQGCSAQASAFVSANAGYANQIAQQTGVPAANLLGLSALESNFGRSNLAANYNNYFGLTIGTAFKGTTGIYTTHDGRRFGIYPSPGFLNSGLSFAQSFQGARVKGVIDPIIFARRLTTPPFAFNSEPGYAGKLINRIGQVSPCD